MTHNFNPDQRHIAFDMKHDEGDMLVATIPSNETVAIPGCCLLFVVGPDGRPSRGRLIEICRASTRTAPWPWDDLWTWQPALR